MQVTTSHLVQLPETAFNYFDRVYKIDDCDPNEWKEYVVLGINWVCTRLKDGIPNDGYWEYEVSKPTSRVTRVQFSEDWLVNVEQLEKEKERYAKALQVEQDQQALVYRNERRGDTFFACEAYM
jgi:hypothetical protein